MASKQKPHINVAAGDGAGPVSEDTGCCIVNAWVGLASDDATTTCYFSSVWWHAQLQTKPAGWKNARLLHGKDKHGLS